MTPAGTGPHGVDGVGARGPATPPSPGRTMTGAGAAGPRGRARLARRTRPRPDRRFMPAPELDPAPTARPDARRPGPPGRLRRPALLRPDRRHPHRRARRPRRAHRLVADPRPRLLPHLRRDPRRPQTAAGSSWPRSSPRARRGATCRARTSWRPRTSPRRARSASSTRSTPAAPGRLPLDGAGPPGRGGRGPGPDAVRGRARDLPRTRRRPGRTTPCTAPCCASTT